MARMPIINMRIVPDGATVWLALSMDPVEVLGIFDNENDAVEACTQFNHMCGPVPFNEKMAIGNMEWKGAYYPKQKE